MIRRHPRTVLLMKNQVAGRRRTGIDNKGREEKKRGLRLLNNIFLIMFDETIRVIVLENPRVQALTPT